MTETHKQTFFVIEVAPSLFLTCYSQGGAYCADRKVFHIPREDYPHLMHLTHEDDFLRETPILHSRKECIRYIQKGGSKEDFLNWCKDLQKKYGGDGKPRIRKVTATLLVDLGDAEELVS